jgi:hypothetical protein
MTGLWIRMAHQSPQTTRYIVSTVVDYVDASQCMCVIVIYPCTLSLLYSYSLHSLQEVVCALAIAVYQHDQHQCCRSRVVLLSIIIVVRHIVEFTLSIVENAYRFTYHTRDKSITTFLNV